MAFSFVGAQHGLGTYSGFIRWTCSKHRRRGGVVRNNTWSGPTPQSRGDAGAHQGLHDGMVGGVHVRVEREGAFSITVVGSVTLGCNDPVLHSKQKETTERVM